MTGISDEFLTLIGWLIEDHCPFFNLQVLTIDEDNEEAFLYIPNMEEPSLILSRAHIFCGSKEILWPVELYDYDEDVTVLLDADKAYSIIQRRLTQF